MPSTPSLQDLATLALERTNQENASVIGQNEVYRYINNSLAELYDVITNTYQDYNILTFTCTLLGGDQNRIPIPSTCHQVRQVEIRFNNGTGDDNYYPIDRFQMPQRNLYGYSGLTMGIPWFIANIKWRDMGYYILIEPTDLSGQEYKVWYVPKWKDLVCPTDKLPMQMNAQAWSEYAVVDTCIKIYDKLGRDASGFKEEKAALMQRVIQSCSHRDIGPPIRTIAVRKRKNGGGVGSGGFGPGQTW